MPGRALVFVNEFDLNTLGFKLEAVRGLPDAIESRLSTAPIVGRDGELTLPPELTTSPRTLDLVGVILASTFTAYKAALQELKERLAAGTIEVRFGDRADRYLVAQCTRITPSNVGPQFANRNSQIGITLICPDPVAYDVQPQIIAATSTVKGVLPVGTATVRPLIQILGAVNNPTVTLRDHRGTVKQTLVITLNIGANDYVEIDCDLGKVTKVVAGTPTVDGSLLTAGDFLRLLPSYAAVSEALYPTIEVSGGTVVASYKRGWN